MKLKSHYLIGTLVVLLSSTNMAGAYELGHCTFTPPADKRTALIKAFGDKVCSTDINKPCVFSWVQGVNKILTNLDKNKLFNLPRKEYKIIYSDRGTPKVAMELLVIQGKDKEVEVKGNEISSIEISYIDEDGDHNIFSINQAVQMPHRWFVNFPELDPKISFSVLDLKCKEEQISGPAPFEPKNVSNYSFTLSHSENGYVRRRIAWGEGKDGKLEILADFSTSKLLPDYIGGSIASGTYNFGLTDTDPVGRDPAGYIIKIDVKNNKEAKLKYCKKAGGKRGGGSSVSRERCEIAAGDDGKTETKTAAAAISETTAGGAKPSEAGDISKSSVPSGDLD
ncbi:MAG: hypothetical protein K0R14_1628 [Burkholderiales bacterium]|jgi:hypothetical protein|nr:hypothetical protein [Burkholderiales bacterium]